MWNEREKREIMKIEIRHVQALEDIAETLEGILMVLHKKKGGGGV